MNALDALGTGSGGRAFVRGLLSFLLAGNEGQDHDDQQGVAHGRPIEAHPTCGKLAQVAPSG